MSLWEETLRYLGWKGQIVDGETVCRIHSAIEICRNISKPRHISLSFPLALTDSGILVEGTTITLTGMAIRRHLKTACKVEIIAATLGTEIDRELTKYSHTDPSYAVLLDAAATAFIEDYCDQVENSLRETCQTEGLFAIPRFSPGYGDLPLDLQQPILSLLNAQRRIGLTCSDSNLLIPRKSVTAIIGLSRQSEAALAVRGCAVCPMRYECDYSRCQRDSTSEKD